MAVEEIPLHLPRNAFGPRDAARAGDVWRLFQDAAVFGSSRRGWPPERYRDERCAFVVRSMTARHHRETSFGEALVARTWVSSFRRQMMSDRQIRVLAAGGEVVAAATQRWFHVSVPELKPTRASPALEQSFGVIESPDGDVALPAFEADPGPERSFSFEAWFTWMDPLAHANHPAYVDWADEATSRLLAEAGVDPHGLVPVAEEVTWRSGVVAPERVVLTTRRLGWTPDGEAVLGHRFEGGDGRLCAEATTVRRRADGRPIP